MSGPCVEAHWSDADLFAADDAPRPRGRCSESHVWPPPFDRDLFGIRIGGASFCCAELVGPDGQARVGVHGGGRGLLPADLGMRLTRKGRKFPPLPTVCAMTGGRMPTCSMTRSPSPRPAHLRSLKHLQRIPGCVASFIEQRTLSFSVWSSCCHDMFPRLLPPMLSSAQSHLDRIRPPWCMVSPAFCYGLIRSGETLLTVLVENPDGL